MCGRFTQLFTWRELHRLMGLTTSPPDPLAPRYTLAPKQVAAVVRAIVDGSREGALLRWGLVPFWAKDLSIGARTINARAETVDAAPSFRAAFKRRRCLVPVSGFYEWRAIEGARHKEPYYITPRAGAVLAFAGLWERWTAAENAPPIETFTIITTDANPAMRAVHQRMPVILAPADWDVWLDSDQQDAPTLRSLLRPSPDDAIQLRVVTPRVNSPRNDDPACIEPPPPEQQPGLW